MATAYQIWNQLPPGYETWTQLMEILMGIRAYEPTHKIKHLHSNGDIKYFYIDDDYLKARVFDEQWEKIFI